MDIVIDGNKREDLGLQISPRMGMLMMWIWVTKKAYGQEHSGTKIIDNMDMGGSDPPHMKRYHMNRMLMNKKHKLT